MDVGLFGLMTLFLGVSIFFVQRSERKRRVAVLISIVAILELIRRYVWYADVHTEGILALITALLLNGSFWLFIGRYNPVASSDDIQVIGMDD